MVQVDVFWSYGFGATFALVASRVLKKEYDEDPVKAQKNKFYSQAFVLNLLFLSVLFVPSGVFLLWGMPDWETMMVAKTHTSIPVWLVTLFAVTNTTQGILGFWITRMFIVRGEFYKGYLNFAIATVLFWIVLIHGWDGTGYQRFFSDSYYSFHVLGEFRFFKWLFGPALALSILGLFVIPGLALLLYPLWSRSIQIERDAVEGTEAAGIPLPRDKYLKIRDDSFYGYMGMSVIGGIAAAAVASIILHISGWLIGMPIVILFYYFCVLRENSPCYIFYKMMMFTGQSEYTINLVNPPRERPEGA